MSIDRLAEALPDPGARGYPPVETWHPDHLGRIDIRIAADGTWYHEGDPIRRAALVRLFSTILRREPDGSYCLVTPVERLAIEVEVAPLFVSEMFVEHPGDKQIIIFKTLTDDITRLDEDHGLTVTVDPATGEPTPLVHVRSNLPGLLARSTFYDLVDLAEERIVDGVAVQGVLSAGQFHVIGRSDGQPAENMQ